MWSAPTRTVGVAVLVFAIVASGVTASAAAGAPNGHMGGDGADPTHASHDGPIAQTSPEADAVSLRAGLAADGTAAWRVTYRIELDDENATAAFEDLRADVESDPTPYVDRFRDRMTRTVRAAENATGREMGVENVSVSASRESLPQGEYGVVVYRLDWRGFAAVESGGDRLRAGDAIDQFFLDGQTSLTVAWPEGYGLESVAPDATSVDERSATWQGRRDFGPGEPRVAVSRGAAPDEGGSTGGDIPLVPIAVALAILLGALGWMAARRFGDDGGGTDGDETGGPGGSGVAGGADGERGGADDGSQGPPPDLLSNEERVLQLLERRGGRIKQQEVATELDWTDAKTSQVVSDLREAGDVESFRLGRENVLTLPDVSIEPDDGDEGGSDAEGGDGAGDGADGSGR